MTVNERVVKATPEQVWEVLADGWLYPLWVVGATRMRGVDESWPQVGARIFHSTGVWPAIIDDETVVRAADPPSSLRLRAKGWPVGEAAVVIHVRPDPAGARVRIAEDAVEGPGRLIPGPLRGALFKWRNTETLRRLAMVVEGRVAQRPADPGRTD